MCGGGSTGNRNSGGLLGSYGGVSGSNYYNTQEQQGRVPQGGWQVSPQLSQGSMTAMVRSPQQYYNNAFPGDQQGAQQGYTGPRIAGQPGTGIHADQVWNPHRSHWSANPNHIVIPPEWSRHPGAYIAHVNAGDPGFPALPGTTPAPTQQAATPPPPTYWGSLEDQWNQFSNNPADWAPGTDMNAAKAAFMAAQGYQTPGALQAMPLPQFVTDEPTNG